MQELSLYDFLKQSNNQYYDKLEKIGAHGDFVTAPEISQLFGEMIAIWILNSLDIAAKQKFSILELGPGMGSLISDIHRCINYFKDYKDQLNKVILIENSSSLRKIQESKLKNIDILYFSDIQDVPNNLEQENIFIIANEFFDALPIRQFKKIKDVWHEAFIHGQEILYKPAQGSENIQFPRNVEIFEYAPDIEPILRYLIAKFTKAKIYLLIIDYAYWEAPNVSTVQAVKQHKSVHFLEASGNCDITHLVDFGRLSNILNAMNFNVNQMSQKDFLIQNGIMQRAEQLVSKGVNKRKITQDLERLLYPDFMGSVFKVLACDMKC